MTTPDLTLSTTEANPIPDAGRKLDAAMAPGGSAEKPLPTREECARMVDAYAFDLLNSLTRHGRTVRQREAYQTADRLLSYFGHKQKAAALAADPAAEVEALRARVRAAREAGEKFGTNAVQRKLYGDVAEAGARAALARHDKGTGQEEGT